MSGTLGTRSRAIRRRTSKEGANGKPGQGKSLSSDSVRARSQKQQKEASRRAAPDARERIPAPAKRLGPIISTVQTNDSTLTRNKGLLVSPLLELFFDRSVERGGRVSREWHEV